MNIIIKLSGFRHKRAKLRNLRLACLMFQYIYLIYSYTNKKETGNSEIILTSMSDNIQSNKQNEKVEDSQGKAKKIKLC